ncbi:DUF4870 domain-containing protein [Paraglaciecola algarum]|uniref:DUF4870 domain-containing protein n=1 Tax=Paraglaciecola algarum TaxID=3050085 RepID=UPI0032E9DB28
MGLVVPFSSFIILALIYIRAGKYSSLINRNIKEALNFQITLFLISIIFVLAYLSLGLLALVIPVIAFFILIFVLFEIVVAIIKASNGETHHIKYSLKMIK